MTQLIPFDYQNKQVRTVLVNDEPWFVAKDVCEVLEIGNPSQALSRLEDDERNTLILNEGTPGNPMAAVVNEPGLYSLILGSRKLEAKAFKRWITHEVIPSIRKNGMYAKDELLDNPDLLLDVVTRLKREREERLLLQAQIQSDKPYTNFGKSIAHSSDSITIGEFAKVCNNNGIRIGRNRLFEWLRNNGYLIKQGRETNNPKQCYIEQGLFELKESVVHTVTDDLIRTTTLLTGKGQMYFLDKLGQPALAEVATGREE